MGNYVSCTLSIGPGGGKQFCRATKVILPGGEVRRLSEPVTAAELMLEMPSFFVVNARALQIGRRFLPLSADEDLEMGTVYAMFPMKRVNSLVTAADMGTLFLTANSAAKRARISPAENCRRVDVAPPSPMKEAQPKLNLDDIEDFSAPEYMHRLSMCRSKKPLLETIAEEPVCSR